MGWIMIQYDISSDHMRIGWIPEAALPSSAKVLDLQYTPVTVRTIEQVDLDGTESACFSSKRRRIAGRQYSNVVGFYGGMGICRMYRVSAFARLCIAGSAGVFGISKRIALSERNADSAILYLAFKLI